ncbi:hypothetical protein GCM10023335_55600 [Streptomyces siamensis]|uniref:Uncharacterized protein n=1 Tax=Streptomyces siamensis TaxID=1274986 RepID=A0ABP9J7I2_9ACTN
MCQHIKEPDEPAGNRHTNRRQEDTIATARIAQTVRNGPLPVGSAVITTRWHRGVCRVVGLGSQKAIAKTSPEDVIATARSGRSSMTPSGDLSSAGSPPACLHTRMDVPSDPRPGPPGSSRPPKTPRRNTRP